MTFAVVGWIDVFIREEYIKILVDSLKYCRQKKGLVIFAYIIMSNHVHFIVRSGQQYKLEEIYRDFNKFTAYKLIRAIYK